MALALSGGINIWGEFPGDTRNNFTNGLTTFLLQAGWVLNTRVPASVSGTYGSVSDGNTIQAGSITYTWKNTINNAVPNEVLVGMTLTDSLNNLVSAINYNLPDSGTLWSNTTLPNPQVSASVVAGVLTFTSLFQGPQGNGTPSHFGILTGGGFKASATSPQLQAGSLTDYYGTHAYMYDKQQTNGGFTLVNHKMMSPDETLASNERSLSVQSGQRFRVVANRCQFFCYLVGTPASPHGSMLSGGIPWIAPSSSCSGDVTQEPATVAFWSSGDYVGLFGSGAQTTPRTVVTGINAQHYSDTDMTGAQVTKNLFDANGYVSTDACWNSDVTTGDSVHDDVFGGFQLVSLQPPFDYSNPSTTTLVDAMRWHGTNGVVGQRMLLEPLVAWTTPGGGTSTDPAQVRGQLWDSWIGTDQVPADTVQTFGDGRTYVAITHVGKFGTLWHIVPAPAPVQFETFQASYAN